MYTVGGREIEFVASEALFLQIARICLETNLKATEVGNVLSQTEVAPAHLAGHFRWQHLQLVVTGSQLLSKFNELSLVGRAGEDADGVETLAAFISHFSFS